MSDILTEIAPASKKTADWDIDGCNPACGAGKN